MTKVTVIIPVYNSSRYMSEAINSVLTQTYKDFEIVVVDDGSTDNSKEIVGQFIEKYPEEIRYIYQKNKGIAGARNTGIRNANGEFMALLDADDKWYPKRLEEGIKIIESSADIGLVHADSIRISEEGRPLPTPKRDKKYLSGYIFNNLFLRKADIHSLTVLFKKECCENVGLFDENPICMGCDDRDLWLRIAKKYRIEYIDKILAQHRVHQNNYSKNLEKMFEARVYVLDKFTSENGKGRKLRRLALARIYKEHGDRLLLKQNFNEAKREYLKAIFLWPFCIWPWINLFKALLHRRIKHDF